MTFLETSEGAEQSSFDYIPSVPAVPPATHASYRPLPDMIGEKVKIITDLNVSLKDDNAVRIRKSLLTRYYSVKAKSLKWKLAGHTPRLLLEKPSFSINENARRKVVLNNSKDPHAFAVGNVVKVPSATDHTDHEKIIAHFKANKARFVSYCPYRTSCFVYTDTNKLPATKEECAELEPATNLTALYAYEHAILAY